ncbi:MAG: Gfo/Idh/MocA family oxidoreductase [Actinobacteria bacterium]|nr:Gfo/Idh/MocA family oxidoreductase [Actinomycetota bacterium]
MTSPVRVAVVGVGYWGPNIVRNLYENPAAEPTWVVDPNPAARKRITLRYPAIREAASIDEVLDQDDVDAVAIVTPVSTHYDLAAKALRAGKHVFVEKPLAASSRDAAELIGIAEARGLVLMPGHTFLYSPPVVKIKQLFDSGELGEILFVTTSRVNLGLHQPDVSVVWDLGPHDFSILRYLLDELPATVSAVSRSCVLPGIPDVAFINLSYPSGTIAHVELSWLAPSKLRRTAIVGSRKMVVYDDTANEPVRVFDTGADLPDPGSFGEYRLTYRTGDIVSPRVDATEPLSIELAEFASAVREGHPIRSSPQVGLDVIKTIEAVERSLADGGRPTELQSGGLENNEPLPGSEARR